MNALSILLRRSALVLLLVPACDADLGELDDDTDGAANTSRGDAGGFEPCSNDNPCPNGQFCWNGLCAIGCTSNGDCADDQYCDTDLLLCQNAEVPGCQNADDCFGEQICVQGLCSTPPEPTACVVGASPDGCESNAVCFSEDDESTLCYTMPACAEDGSCPVGLAGAVCNDGYLPDKDRICLLGACEDETHCPGAWSCVKPAEGSLGLCGSGTLGAPCIDGDDCSSGVCTNPLGAIGFCG